VVDQGYHPRVVASGHLAYVVGGTLMTVPFDARTLRTRGTAVRAVESINTQPIQGVASFGASASGTLAYTAGEPRRRTLTWVERDGRSVPLAVEPDRYSYPRLSPDEGRLAVSIEREGRDVWIVDLKRQTRNRITADRGNNPPPAITAWTPDGTRVAFNRRTRSPETTLEWVDASTNEQPTVLVKQPFLISGPSWSRDGRTLAFFVFDDVTQRDLWVKEGDAPPRIFLATAANERAPRFSPDGRWIAYMADPNGRDEVFLRPFPGPGGAVTVSTNGGTEPVWSGDGRELFYREGARMMAVSVQTAPTLMLGRPQPLFEGAYLVSELAPAFDATRDGRRFLMISAPPPPPTGISIVQNWTEELKRLAPAN
jgi:serine/threonine-protein kinase